MKNHKNTLKLSKTTRNSGCKKLSEFVYYIGNNIK